MTASPAEAAEPHEAVSPPVPDLTGADAAFGNIKHMPRYEDVPDEFKRHSNPHVRFVSDWFFNGLSKENFARLKPHEGVDKDKALRAISAILRSFALKHEHKEAGAAYLLSRWFRLEG